MNTVLRYSLGYVIGIVILLVVVALYFFFMMSKSFTGDREKTNTILAENKSLAEQSKNLKMTISRLEDQLSEQAKTLQQEQALITQLKNNNEQPELQIQCQTIPSPEVITVRDRQEKESHCAAKLAEMTAQIETLEIAAQRADNTKLELQSTKNTIQELQAELDSVRETNQKLLIDKAERLSTDQTRLVETQLVQANQQISRLQTRLNQVLAEKEELTAAASISGELEIIEFLATPNFCNKKFSQGRICLASIEIMATFNFSPNGFIAVKVIDPTGDTIKRESIAGRKTNRVLFDIDEGEPSLTGEYVIEFSVNDIFNPFNQTQRFSIVP